MFPKGYFYILSRKNGFALDVYDGQIKEDANIIVWPQKFEDSDNQLWSYDNGRLINKKSGHALDIRSSAFKKDKAIVQNKRKDNNQSQFWLFDQGFLCSQEYPSMVFDIKGDSEKGGAQVLLYKRKETDNLNQQWYLEPYHDIESSLNMATKTISLHKKEGFGLPRLGYGAEVGIPPELTKLPDDIKVAGVIGSTSPTPSQPSHSDPYSPYPEALEESRYQSPTSTYSAPVNEPAHFPTPPKQHHETSSQHQPFYPQGPGYPPPPQHMPIPGTSGPGVGGFYVPPTNTPPSYPYPSYPPQ
ncbi:ricin B lectin domain-containing protein [Chlamydoabsidia padenii]|nr:ricin B lectin domain-containing protein [Chlamydoabsidia padenii]